MQRGASKACDTNDRKTHGDSRLRRESKHVDQNGYRDDLTAAAQEPTARVVTIPFDVGTPNGTGAVQLTFGPGRVGDNTVEALVYGPDKGIATVPELRLTLTQNAQRIGPLDAKLANKGGYWAADRLRLPLSGTWTLRVTVRVTDIDQVTVSKNVTIRPSLF